MKTSEDKIQLVLAVILGGVLGSLLVFLIFPRNELGLADFRLAFVGGAGISCLILYLFKWLSQK